MSTMMVKRNIVPGAIVSGYRVKRELGRGAMAVVYLAVQENLDRPVALKILSESLANNHEFVARFFNEARSAASFSHTKIVQAFDAGVAPPDIYYFAMEYIEGETLYNRIKREKNIGTTNALAIAVDIAEALDYGWKRQKLIHGDIKPENIMLSIRGDTKLADFGLAKVSGHDYAGEGTMLTPLYASPEAIQGKAQPGDCRPDIYSFGATVYHMLAGEPPFPGTDPQTVMRMHVNNPVPSLAKANPKISKELSDFIVKLLSKQADDRPQSWEDVLHSLEWFQNRKLRNKTTPTITFTSPRAAMSSTASSATTPGVQSPENSARLRVRKPAAANPMKATPVPGVAARRSAAPAEEANESKIWIMGGAIGAAVLLLIIIMVAVIRKPSPSATPAPVTTTGAAAQGGTVGNEIELNDREYAAWEKLSDQLYKYDKDPRACVKFMTDYQTAQHGRVHSEFKRKLKEYQDRVKFLESSGK